MRGLILILLAFLLCTVGYLIEKDAQTIFLQIYSAIAYLGGAVLFGAVLICDQIDASHRRASKSLASTLMKLAQVGYERARAAEKLDQSKIEWGRLERSCGGRRLGGRRGR